MTRSGYRESLLALVAGGALAFFGFGQTWVTVSAQQPGLPAAVRTISGRELEAGAGVLPLLLLAAVLAVWATAGWLRRAVGVVAALAAVGIVLAALRSSPALLDPAGVPDRLELVGTVTTTGSWWWLPTLLGGLLALAGALLVVARGGRWPGWSDRYRRAGAGAPAAAAHPGEPMTSRATWDLLDAGRDPTVPDPAGPPRGEPGSPAATGPGTMPATSAEEPAAGPPDRAGSPEE
jgi:uncharacterized membrane protein (TIGR02234 family)